MDISQTTAPKSDQQNFDDYIGGPKTVTIEKVTAGSLEQPVDVHLVEFPGRPYRPSKSMRRAIDIYARCIATDTWPGDDDEPGDAEPIMPRPYYLESMDEEEMVVI